MNKKFVFTASQKGPRKMAKTVVFKISDAMTAIVSF